MKVVFALFAVVAITLAVPQQRSSVVECEMCEIAVKVADPSATKDLTTIENDFITECEKVIPGKIGKIECQNYANKELGGIIKELQSGTAPKDVCTKIHTC